MKISWEADKVSAFVCLIIFTAVTGFLGFFAATSIENPFVTAAFAGFAGFLFWALFAVQDLRVSFRKQ
jgi:hypothetical protein